MSSYRFDEPEAWGRGRIPVRCRGRRSGKPAIPDQARHGAVGRRYAFNGTVRITNAEHPEGYILQELYLDPLNAYVHEPGGEPGPGEYFVLWR